MRKNFLLKEAKTIATEHTVTDQNTHYTLHTAHTHARMHAHTHARTHTHFNKNNSDLSSP